MTKYLAADIIALERIQFVIPGLIFHWRTRRCPRVRSFQLLQCTSSAVVSVDFRRVKLIVYTVFYEYREAVGLFCVYFIRK